MKHFSKTFLKCISETQITSVRAGRDREKFTGIWMVEVEAGSSPALTLFLSEAGILLY
jgi:hypothetical protein